MAALLLLLFPTLTILLVIYLILTYRQDYWKKRNVPYLKPSLLFGNYKKYMTLKTTLGENARDICRQLPNESYIGTYYGTEPALLVQDPELIKLIFAKDYNSFSGREIVKYAESETFGKNMFSTYGDKWKVARQNISPLFSTSKLKSMFPLVIKCSREFEDLLKYETSMCKTIEARTIISRYTMECICSMAFGIDANVMEKDADYKSNQFRKIGDLIFEISNIRGLFTYFRAVWPGVFYGLGFRLFPRAITDFFENLTTEVMENRGHKPSSRNDFIDMLLTLKKHDYLTCESIESAKKGETISVKVDDKFLSAQCLLFFGAGYETSATTSSTLLYRLAKDQEAQKRAVEEIDAYLKKRGGKIEFDCITELPYLDACFSETLRLSPVLSLLTREVMEPYKLPSGLVLEKGLRVHVPVYHLHMNPAYFPDPESFKPERFLPENKDQITPYTFMPFGEGQRICMGMRVAKMQSIPGLITVLRNYRVELADNMPKYEFEPRSPVSMARYGLPLKFIPRN